MAGLVPVIHAFAAVCGLRRYLVDARIKSGHDGSSLFARRARRWQEVDFVGDEQCIGAGPGFGAGGIAGRARVEHKEPDFGFGGAMAGAAQPLLLDRVVAVAQAGGVGEDHRVAGEIDRDLDDVARRPGDRRGDRRLTAGDAVQQARFAGIGRADDCDRDAVAQPLAAMTIGEMTGDFAGKLANIVGDRLFERRRQFLVGKIDHRFEMGENTGQMPRPIAIKPAQFATELAQGLAALRLGFGGGEIGDRLGLGQVELAVLKGAAGEFPGFGKPEPETAQRIGDRGEHRAAAVQMQFGDILAGKARGGGKPQHQRIVERFAAIRVNEAAMPRGSRRREGTG